MFIIYTSIVFSIFSLARQYPKSIEFSIKERVNDGSTPIALNTKLKFDFDVFMSKFS